MIICACSEAKADCEKVCAKGRLIEPERVWRVPWMKSVHIGHAKALRDKTLKEMREG